MEKIKFEEAVLRSQRIRKIYHQLEVKQHGAAWTVEEDALAFLTDAGLVGRLTMSQQGRWPAGDETQSELKHKLGECMWWLTVLAMRMDIDIDEEFGTFLLKTIKQLEPDL